MKSTSPRPNSSRPNIIIILADDLGYGDVSCYGATRLNTPNIDRLAADGQLFWQGYATASTCTPSRYSLLTGSYPWRNPRAQILNGDAAQIIPNGAPTLSEMFRSAGYATAIVGKWHLGLGDGNIDWNSDNIQGTPNDVGFDCSYIMASTNDRTPCVYIDNRQVDNLDPNDPLEVTYNKDEAYPDVPNADSHPEMLELQVAGHRGTIIDGVSRIGYMRGGKSAVWNDETMCDVFLGKAISFIEDNREDPFFLYYALHEPHDPRIPAPRFAGATDLGPRGDVIVEMDWCVGQVLDKLDELGLRENTIVIFSSDNGPAMIDAYEDGSDKLAKGHKPAGSLRGGKYSSYEGGTRVPFIVSWPGTVQPGESDALVCQMDFHASFASMLNQELQPDEAPDSENLLDAFLGKTDKGRDELVVEGNRKNTVMRLGHWAYIPPYEGRKTHNDLYDIGNSPEPQLYDLSGDIGQCRDVVNERPDMLESMQARLNEIRQSERTRNQ